MVLLLIFTNTRESILTIGIFLKESILFHHGGRYHIQTEIFVAFRFILCDSTMKSEIKTIAPSIFYSSNRMKNFLSGGFYG